MTWLISTEVLQVQPKFFQVEPAGTQRVALFQVLTAAHCLHYIRDKGEGSYAKFFVAAGLDHNLRSIIPSTANNRGIYEIYPHPNFTKIRGVSYHDVGLIQLNYAFDLNAKTNIFPVCLINEDEKRFGNLYGAGYAIVWIN